MQSIVKSILTILDDSSILVFSSLILDKFILTFFFIIITCISFISVSTSFLFLHLPDVFFSNSNPTFLELFLFDLHFFSEFRSVLK